jgi:hypothetical protein
MPKRLVRAIFGPHVPGGFRRKSRCLSLLENGLVMHPDFCGRQGFEVGLSILQAELVDHGLPGGWLINWRASEPCLASREAIMFGRTKPEHCYPTVAAIHLSPDDVQFMDENRPKPDASKEDWLAFNLKTSEYITKNSATIYRDGQTSSNCTLHPNAFCPVRWEDSRDDPDRALSMGMGGPHCLPWSRAGEKLGLAHPDLEHYNVFIGEHASGQFDFSLCEEAATMPSDHYAKPMRPLYNVIFVRFGDEDLGVPNLRYRFFGAGSPNNFQREPLLAHYVHEFKNQF